MRELRRDGTIRAAAKRLLPPSVLVRIRALRGGATPPVGAVRFGSLRRLAPLSRSFGFDRGTPVDRHYIDDFLARYSGREGYGKGDIRGRVLEIGGDTYARRFGGWRGPDHGERSTGRPWVDAVDVLDASSENPHATVVGDLASGVGVAVESYDCIICTQTLHLIYDPRAAVATLYRALRPGGVALVTVAGISQVCRPDRELWGDYWRFTTLSARRVFEEAFPAENVTVEAYGNVLTSAAFLYGLAAEELAREELDSRDPDYELLIGVRAKKDATP